MTVRYVSDKFANSYANIIGGLIMDFGTFKRWLRHSVILANIPKAYALPGTVKANHIGANGASGIECNAFRISVIFCIYVYILLTR